MITNIALFQPSDDVSGASDIELVIEDNMDRVMRIVNEKFEARETQIKDELRSEFEDRISKIERSHELSVRNLKRELSNLSKVSLECEYLKTLQKELRKELDNQQEKIRRLTRENQRLKASSKSNSVTEDNEKLKEENEKLKEENKKRESEIDKLSKFITLKEAEIANLKTQIDTQYKKIKLDLTNTRDKFRTEHINLNAGMKKQELLLTEISEAVRHISKAPDNAPMETKTVKTTKEDSDVKPQNTEKSGKEIKVKDRKPKRPSPKKKQPTSDKSK